MDEPGLSLHAKAQSDLLRYFEEKLKPHHQLIYTTHSPFMVPANDLMSVRTVEDVVVRHEDGRIDVLGTKVGDRVLSTDRDTLFPLQSALGYASYAKLVNLAYKLSAAHALADTRPVNSSPRAVKVVETHFRTLPPVIPEFDHFLPSSVLIEGGTKMIQKLSDDDAMLSRFEKLFQDLNGLLK